MRQALLESESYFNIINAPLVSFHSFQQEFRDKSEHAQMHSCPPFWPFKHAHEFQNSFCKLRPQTEHAQQYAHP